MGFFGKQSVIATWKKQPKKTTSSLVRRTSGDTYATGVDFQSYVAPVQEMTGLGGDGSPTQSTTIYLYRLGQSVGPSVEDKIVDSRGNTWLIQSVSPRLNEHEESDGYCVYDCQVYKIATA